MQKYDLHEWPDIPLTSGIFRDVLVTPAAAQMQPGEVLEINRVALGEVVQIERRASMKTGLVKWFANIDVYVDQLTENEARVYYSGNKPKPPGAIVEPF